MNKNDSFTVVWDSGASSCISFDKDEFVVKINPVAKGSSLSGISNGLRIEGTGTVAWSIIDASGSIRTLNLPAYYVPKSRQRLLSTTVFNQQYPRNKVTLGNPKWSIRENPSDPSESAIDVYLNPQNNLPTSTCF